MVIKHLSIPEKCEIGNVSLVVFDIASGRPVNIDDY
jgi:hypothetical protein